MTGGAHDLEHRPRIVVFGVGGAGGNAVNNMVAAALEGVEFVVANTDAQALAFARPEHRLQLGLTTTQGLGAGSRPETGRKAAEESLQDIVARLGQAHMVFVTAGMGGGTGTGAAPVIAKAARKTGALVVGVVTKPFDLEGPKRMRIAEEGVRELEREVDTLIVIPNQNLFRIATEKTGVTEAFKLADEVLHSGVRGVTDLMTRPGLVNLDFADVRTVMSEMGKAVIGSGEAEGPRRASDAAHAAIANPLLDDLTLKGAAAALINISGGPGMTLYEIDEAASAIRAEIDPDANIIVGAAIDPTLGDRIRVSVVATGIPVGAARTRRPAPTPATEPVGGFTFEPPIREAKPRAFTPERRPETPPPDREPSPAQARDDQSAYGIMNTLNARRTADVAEPIVTPPLPADVRPEDEDDRGARPGFSLFGRRRRSGGALEDDEPIETPVADPSTDDADLEIPAFLRRQSN